jgi:prepilin-type processing-associated H-X9-DG protein
MNLRFDTMDKPKLVAAIAVTAAVLAVSGSVMLTRPSGAADRANLKKQRAAAGMPDMEAMCAKMLEQTAAELGLTTGQKEQFQAAQDRAETSRRALFEDKSLATFGSAAEWMLLGEEAFQVTGSPLDGVFLRTDSTDDGYLLYGLNLLSTRHQEGSNITFIDGHSKWLRPDQVFANKYPTGGGDTCQ